MRVLFVVPTVESRTLSPGNGTQTAFPTGFVFELNTHILVTLVNDESGAGAVQTEGVHYTLTGGGGFAGTVTMVTAPPVGTTLVIERNVPFTQTTNLRDGDPFRATTQMLTFDRVVEMIQQLADLVGRSPVGPITLPVVAPGSGLLLPAPIDETIIVGTGAGWESRALSEVIAGTGFSLSTIHIFNNSGTWTKPTGFQGFLIVECLGGGGGGAGVPDAVDIDGEQMCTIGGGGGAGAYAWKRIPDIDLAASVTVTIGAAGAGGAAGMNNGGNGGDTTFGSAVVAEGGDGGASMASANTQVAANGGNGGLAANSTGDLTADGGDGATGLRGGDSSGGDNPTRINQLGDGGASIYGGAARASLNAAGRTGKKYGGGGAGACSQNRGGAFAGGSGYAGVCIVYVFGGAT